MMQVPTFFGSQDVAGSAWSVKPEGTGHRCNPFNIQEPKKGAGKPQTCLEDHWGH